MWTADRQAIARDSLRFSLRRNGEGVACREVIDLWCGNEDFRGFFTALLADSPFEAFFWESKPVAAQALDQAFECVVIDAPSLSRLQPDPGAFASHFDSAPAVDVLTFPNLGRDAQLVVPAPRAADACYSHLGRFVRTAPPAQVEELWRSVGRAMRERISSEPTWLSTAGTGVAWLHVRLDSWPKYYRHANYRRGT
jgi:Family of unknown function (DUF6940)